MKGNTDLSISIADIQDAIEYWMNEAVLKQPAKVADVKWVPGSNSFDVKWVSGSNSFRVSIEYPAEEGK